MRETPTKRVRGAPRLGSSVSAGGLRAPRGTRRAFFHGRTACGAALVDPPAAAARARDCRAEPGSMVSASIASIGVTRPSGSLENDQVAERAPMSRPSMYTGLPLIPATTPLFSRTRPETRTST
jgi:hypothetical protein